MTHRITLLFILVLTSQAQAILPPSPLGHQMVTVESAVDDRVSKQVEVVCPQGLKAVGAGWAVLDETGAILEGQATHNAPGYAGDSWLVNAKKLSRFVNEWKLRVRATCLAADTSPGPEPEKQALVVVTEYSAINKQRYKNLTAYCPSGYTATGAGWAILDPTRAIMNNGYVTYNMPAYNGDSWYVKAVGSSTKNWMLQLRVLCVLGDVDL